MFNLKYQTEVINISTNTKCYDKIRKYPLWS